MIKLMLLIITIGISAELKAEISYSELLEWGKKAGYIIKPDSYFCPYEKFTRNIANYMQTHGRVSKRTIIQSGCSFVNISGFAKVIKVSKDNKVAEILTHEAIYDRNANIVLKKAFIETRYLQTIKEFKNRAY